MGTVITKSKLYQGLFVLCVVIPYFDNYELTIAVWTFVTLLSIQKTYSTRIFRQLFYFSAILLLAFLVSFFKEYKTYFVIRDITYIIKPILGIMIGYQLCRNIKTNIFNAVVYAGLTFSLVHFLFMARGILFFNIRDINSLRYYCGFFSDFEVFSLIIILFHRKFELTIPPKKRLLYMLIIGVSAASYLARTNFIQFGILFLALKGFFILNRRNLIILSSLAGLILVGYSTILMINPKRNGPGIEAFLYKIKIIPQEALKSRVNPDNWKEFNDNYRSYENIMTVRQMSLHGGQAMLFGEGLGSQVNLKRKLYLGDEELQYISILHNGYMTVYLKSGLIGICFLLMSFGIYFKRADSPIPIIKQINLLLLGMGIFMIMSYWVFMGFYFKADNKAILLGLLICYREIVLAKHKKGLQE